jgi:Ser-tRNA(Ala) deacylase AlaX
MTASNDEAPDDVAPTEMLYFTYAGNFELECDATILSCRFIDKDISVDFVLDKTVMHAQGGGQPTDLGTIQVKTSDGKTRTISVEKVLLNRATGVATHTGKLNDEGTSADIKAGDAVHVSVNAENRRILSECHSAGHVVDSAMARCGKLLPPIKGYHFLDGPYVEYKGTIPEDERPELLEKLQVAFGQLVSEDIETNIQVLPKEKAEEVCNRVAENYFNLNEFGDDTVRIVTVAGWPCPCGGTHVKSTGHLKERKWGVTGIKCKKGAVRVKYGQNC